MRIRFVNGYNGKSDIVKENTRFISKLKKNVSNINHISSTKKKFYLDSNAANTPEFIPQDNPLCQKTDTPHDKTITTLRPFGRWFKFFELQNDVFEQPCSIADGMCFIREI